VRRAALGSNPGAEPHVGTFELGHRDEDICKAVSNDSRRKSMFMILYI
jgi:hypothetical protein